jgi:hypothetical protein
MRFDSNNTNECGDFWVNDPATANASLPARVCSSFLSGPTVQAAFNGTIG